MKTLKFNQLTKESESKILDSLAEINDIHAKLYNIANEIENNKMYDLLTSMFDHIQIIKNNI